MAKFKLDSVAIESRYNDYNGAALDELAFQLRPYVPGATPDEGLEALLNRLLPREPPADLVEEMAQISWLHQEDERGNQGSDAEPMYWADLHEDAREAERAGIRAVLRAISHGDAQDWLPSAEDLAVQLWHAPLMQALDSARRIRVSHEELVSLGVSVHEIVATHIAPRLAALRAEVEACAKGASVGSALSVMLASYGLPNEPKALALRIEAERGERDAIRAENERLREELAAAKRQAHIAETMLADAQREAGR